MAGEGAGGEVKPCWGRREGRRRSAPEGGGENARLGGFKKIEGCKKNTR